MILKQILRKVDQRYKNFGLRYISANMEASKVEETKTVEKLPYKTYREYFEDSYRVRYRGKCINAVIL